ncbi:M1 family metallopeptidase [candidate division KSB1 bacterium]|nr:M1 family metallopeptidase [candidate division KSB1 bacterium]
MKKFFKLIFILFIVTAPLFAQKLPTGAYHGNRERNYDIIHYKAELSFDFEKKQVFGKSTIRLTPLRRIENFAFDAIHLNIKSVSSTESTNGLAFRSTGDSLIINLPQARNPNDTFSVVVQYEGNPKSGMYFRRNPDNPQLFYVTTYGENGLHANWLPIYNDMNDKFSTEMLVTVPPPYVVISNGKLVETLSQPDGQKTFHWLHKLPHSNYLISIYVGDFEKGDLADAFGNIPLSYWVPRGWLKEGAYAFRNTPKMVEFFSQRFNYKYPWDKYDQIAAPDYAIGAMEHTGVTGHRAEVLRDQNGPNDFAPNLDEYTSAWTAEATISHELAHHWFGDNLTCRNLSYIWLNESFASYLMMLWDEELLGKDQLLLDVQIAKDQYIRYVRSQHIIRGLEHHYFDDANTIYNTEHTYLKGAAILHTLRQVLGDEPYFRALSHYLHKHEFSNVVSEDLKIAIEEATGENLEWFFDQWITNGGHPQFEVSYRYLADRKLVDLSVKQVQPIVEGLGNFDLPVKITIATATKRWQEKIWIRNESENFLFACEEKPVMVSFDGEGDLIAEVHFPKSLDELIYQTKNTPVPGRIWAIRELAAKFPTQPRAVSALSSLIAGNDFWGVRAEATLQLGTIRTPAAEQALAQALKSTDYRIRKAAVLALPKFGTASAEQKLKDVIKSDAQNDVVATAILALARANAQTDPEFIKQQLGRKSWQDEIVVGCLRAFGEMKNPALVATIKKYTSDAYNQNVVGAALTAWVNCAPNDKELHKMLIATTQSPVYALQQSAINMLGRLSVSDAAPALKEILAQDADANLTVAARGALEGIQRVGK